MILLGHATSLGIYGKLAEAAEMANNQETIEEAKPSLASRWSNDRYGITHDYY